MSLLNENFSMGVLGEPKSMQYFGENFIVMLPKYIQSLKIPGRNISDDLTIKAQSVKINKIEEIQMAMQEVICDQITQQAHFYAENTFNELISKNGVDGGLLRFFNGWDNTHKTTSLVSAKIILRLSGDSIFIPVEQQIGYCRAMAHMHEVTKDDFGLGHKGHDGMYAYMVEAFNAINWSNKKYEVLECNQFCDYLYGVGVAEHKSPLGSDRHGESILNAMMVSVASEVWNGREFNYLAQYINGKLLAISPRLAGNASAMRNARGYVMGHAGDVENKHGLHALAAAQMFASTRDIEFSIDRLKEVMLDYNKRVGISFDALHREMLSEI